MWLVCIDDDDDGIMKVLIACEFSGQVRKAFEEQGHNATSCDLLDSEIPGSHYKGDVRDLLGEQWDLMIAHPPCTFLAVSGARWFKDRRKQQAEALDFVRELMDVDIPRIAIENPHISENLIKLYSLGCSVTVRPKLRVSG